MAIPDLSSHGKHIGYTMTLAAGGFAYTDAKYDDGATLFGIEAAGPMLAATLSGAALVCFLIALGVGVFALFGMSGLSQLGAHKANLEAELERDKIADALDDLSASSCAAQTAKRLAATTLQIEGYANRLKRNSTIHLTFLGIGFVLSALLFADSKFDADPKAPTCVLEVDAQGQLVLPVACTPDG